VLRCYPFYQQAQNQYLQYLDYNHDAKSWQHISCVQNGNDRELLGLIGQDQFSYTYFSDLSKVNPLPNSTFSLYLNLNPTIVSSGVSKSYY
jgi:hypothetical protein